MEQRKTELTTVVIPNYNGIAYMENCLKSLYAGSRIPEIIVVDNASKDGSDVLVREKFPEAELKIKDFRRQSMPGSGRREHLMFFF